MVVVSALDLMGNLTNYTTAFSAKLRFFGACGLLLATVLGMRREHTADMGCACGLASRSVTEPATETPH